MLEEVQGDARELHRQPGFADFSPSVLQALATVPRREFVPPELAGQANRNLPLPIGAGQTISQPFIVALMTELAGLAPGDRVFELGTGSGYQAAILAELGATVCSVELLPQLAAEAKTRLRRLGYTKIRLRVGNGCIGWPELAPFRAVLVTAAAASVPPALLEQLSEGGRLVMPVGGEHQVQQLLVKTRQEDGTFTERKLLPVRFVPIRGDEKRA